MLHEDWWGEEEAAGAKSELGGHVESPALSRGWWLCVWTGFFPLLRAMRRELRFHVGHLNPQ